MSSFLSLLRRFLRGNSRLIFSYLRANWRLFLFGLVIGSVIIYLFPQIEDKLFVKKAPVIGLVGNYTLATLPLSIQKEISFGLTSLTPDGKATPAAASKWTVENDGKTINFDLKEDLFWQDGTKFDASQINYNLKGVEVKRLSLYKIQFNFKEAFSPLITIVSQPLFKNGLVGLGDQRVEGLKFNGRFLSTLTLRNQKDATTKAYKFFPNEKSAATAIKLGSVTQLHSLHQTYSLETDPHYKISATTAANTLVLIFLNLHKEILAEKSFRQALAYSLPDTFKEGEEAPSPLPKDSWAISTGAKKYSQNLELSKRLLGKLASPSGQPKITLSSPEELQDVARQIASSWQQAGIPTATIITTIPTFSYDAHLTYLDLPVDPDQYALWHSTQKGNLSGYKSFKVDHLLEDGRRTFKQSDRKDIYAAMEKTLTEDLPALFLYYPKLYTITRK